MTRLLTLCVALLGCGGVPAPPDAGADAGPTACPRVTADPPRSVDVLFVIDNSRAVIEQQWAMRDAVGPFLRSLATGDVDGDGAPDAAPLDVHAGVISSDMGDGDAALCAGGRLGDGVLITDSPGLCATSTDPVLRSADGVELLVENAGCRVLLGQDGCEVEQPLEALLKAITPSTDRSFELYPPGSVGHADGANAGFLRADSVLVVVLMLDEDDCSLADPRLFTDDPRYAGSPIGATGVRCAEHPEALHPVSRYVEALRRVRPELVDVVFAEIVGIPQDVSPAAGAPIDFDTILADPRMVPTADDAGFALLSSCQDPRTSPQHPPPRLVRFLQDLEREGARAAITTGCDFDTYDPMLAHVASLARAQAASRCE